MAQDTRAKGPLGQLLDQMRQHRQRQAEQGKTVEQRNAEIDAVARAVFYANQAKARELREEALALRAAPPSNVPNAAPAAQGNQLPATSYQLRRSIGNRQAPIAWCDEKAHIRSRPSDATASPCTIRQDNREQLHD